MQAKFVDDYDLRPQSKYEQELSATADIVQKVHPIGEIKGIGLLEVAAGVQWMANEISSLREEIGDYLRILSGEQVHTKIVELDIWGKRRKTIIIVLNTNVYRAFYDDDGILTVRCMRGVNDEVEWLAAERLASVLLLDEEA